MKIKLVSDLHLEFTGWTKDHEVLLDNNDPDIVLVIAGDIAAWARFKPYGDWGTCNSCGPVIQQMYDFLSPRYKHVVMILGNHDYWGTTHDFKNFDGVKKNYLPLRDNISLLTNHSIVIDDVEFIGTTYWTDLQRNDPIKSVLVGKSLMGDFGTTKLRFDNDVQLMLPKDWCEMNRIAKEFVSHRLKDSAALKRVVVMHMAPHRDSSHPRFKNDSLGCAFYNTTFELDHWDNWENIDLIVHGHMHDPVDYDLRGVRVVCNPWGYGNEFRKNGYDPSKILEV